MSDIIVFPHNPSIKIRFMDDPFINVLTQKSGDKTIRFTRSASKEMRICFASMNNCKFGFVVTKLK